jgi:hypothetical protein
MLAGYQIHSKQGDEEKKLLSSLQPSHYNNGNIKTPNFDGSNDKILLYVIGEIAC